MRRTKLVLAAAALMVAMLMALSAPAMADDGRNHNNHHNGWNNWNNWDHYNDFNHFNNDRYFYANDFYDDCEWEFEEGWFLGFWGWQWGAWFLDC